MDRIVSQNYINGKFVPALGQKIDLFDPVTGQTNGTLHSASFEDVKSAVHSAQAAFETTWALVSMQARLPYLEKLISLIEKRSDEIASLISMEIGAPIDFARNAQVVTALKHLKAALTAGRDLPDERLGEIGDPNHRVRYDPAGVAALITPWNWPLNQIALKIGGALLSGCPMVLKPSEMTPAVSHLFCELMHELDLPDGVFNMVQGGADVGAALVAAPEVRVISFTGSTATGGRIAANVAPQFKQMILELGGKSPNILLADCDVDLAVSQGVAHCFRNTGQSCNAASVMLVEEAIYDQAVETAKRVAQNIEFGLPSEAGSHLGPMVNEAQYRRLQGLIDQGLKEGARLVAGGLGHPDGFTGCYARASVFADVSPEMTLAQTELFGPVLSMIPVKDVRDAVRVANLLPYGLAGYVQTNNVEAADYVARHLHAGTIQVNGTSRQFGTPFGGMKASGLGREGGAWGIRSYQVTRTISGVAQTIEY